MSDATPTPTRSRSLHGVIGALGVALLFLGLALGAIIPVSLSSDDAVECGTAFFPSTSGTFGYYLGGSRGTPPAELCEAKVDTRATFAWVSIAAGALLVVGAIATSRRAVPAPPAVA